MKCCDDQSTFFSAVIQSNMYFLTDNSISSLIMQFENAYCYSKFNMENYNSDIKKKNEL